ncbi:hypothetical protein B0H66DRAFT_596325 [Apodospora peruviana]|uniref:Carrier domain-containing protein n=1 Tax=Apodospora peruviana TaxID=516989 RepID=A0AAE0HRW2_9PEZI|nr:hypothetical protein B0H66DRAFT_596325 [Apodospora peruviana]
MEGGEEIGVSQVVSEEYESTIGAPGHPAPNGTSAFGSLAVMERVARGLDNFVRLLEWSVIAREFASPVLPFTNKSLDSRSPPPPTRAIRLHNKSTLSDSKDGISNYFSQPRGFSSPSTFDITGPSPHPRPRTRASRQRRPWSLGTAISAMENSDYLSSRLAGYLQANGHRNRSHRSSSIREISLGSARVETWIDHKATGAKLALSSASCHQLCSTLAETTFTVTESSIHSIKPSSRTTPVWNAGGPNNAAYVMATSGSTGTPKLVVTEHSQLASFVAYLTKPLGFTNGTRAFQFASYAFDPIIGDIFLTLCVGGTVCIPSEDERKNDIVGAMSHMRVNLAKFTPSLVHSLVGLTPAKVPTLKTLVLGGETAPKAVIETWAGKVDLKLIYGSTECTISCVVQVTDANARSIVPGEMGFAVGSRAWVVNPTDYQILAKDGEIGELVLEGPLVSRGYLNNAAQSEAKYIKAPKWSDYTHRMYRTGDLVRRLDDGRLVYVGRVDNQVKIRGQRLELEDVEQHLRQALSVLLPPISAEDILVDFTAPFGSTSKQLVAFLSFGSTTSDMGCLLYDDDDKGGSVTISLTPETQRNFAYAVSKLEAGMKLTVPAYMVPTLWIPIDKMPYTLSRKRDRQRLRKAIEGLTVQSLTSFHRAEEANGTDDKLAITTEREALLQRLWSDILNMDLGLIFPTDNFFYLGGNSLSALRLISMARQEGHQLTVDTIFQFPVLRDLASRLIPIERSGDAVAPFALLDHFSGLSIQHEAAQQCGVDLSDIEDILPLYSMQNHYITGYPELGRDIAGPWDWQQQIVFELPDSFDVQLFKSVWDTAIKRHGQLRARVISTSHGFFQATMCYQRAPAWRDADDLDAYVSQDKSAVMSFGDELLRLAIVSSGQERYFVMTMQHLIYDAFSRDLLFRELEAGYIQQLLPRDQPPKMSSFIKIINKALPNSSRGKPSVGELKLYKMALEKPKLPSWQYTLASVIEVSGALAIAQTLNCADVILYSDRAGRNLPVAGIQDLVAPTTLFLPLRVHVDYTQTVHDLLCVHQAASTAMIPHEHVDWIELREMDHLKPILKHSLNMNINPYTPLSKLGAGMGLNVMDEHETCDDPFGINVSVGEDSIECTLYFDETFVSEDAVKDLAVLIRDFFRLVAKVHTNQGLSVGGLMDWIGQSQ